jgi:hypothetical protein
VSSRQPLPASPLRRAVEARSAGVLLALTRLPRWLIAIAAAAVLLVGLAIDGIVGAVCLLVVAVVLGWLTFLAWPALAGPARALRVATLALLGFAVGRAMHWF